MEEGSIIMTTETSMMERGKETKNMVMENIPLATEKCMCFCLLVTFVVIWLIFIAKGFLCLEVQTFNVWYMIFSS